MSAPTTTTEIEAFIKGFDNVGLMAQYDLFNNEREKICRQWGHCMSGDDMKKVEALTDKINAMRAEIVRRMGESK